MRMFLIQPQAVNSTDLSQVGVFNFCVNSLGNKGGNGEVNAFFDSSYDCSGVFVVYDELLLFNRGFVNKNRNNKYLNSWTQVIQF